MSKNIQLAVIDTETTGLSPAKHELIEVAIIRFEQWFEEDKSMCRVLSRSEYKFNPINIESADPIALKINGYTSEKWAQAVPHREGLTKIQAELMYESDHDQKINDLVLIGHNIHFDVSFLMETFRRHSIDFEMNKRAIDVYSVALRAIGRLNQKSFSLGSLCERFGIEHKNRHTAMGDTQATYEVYKKLFDITEIA